MNKVGAIVCTRLNSRRIPNKALVPVTLEKTSAIRVLVERLLMNENKSVPYDVCIALTGLPEDEPIYQELKDLPVKFYRGHPDNPLARMVKAAKQEEYDTVVRVTHDDILQSPRLISLMVEEHHYLKSDYTYVSQCVRGMDVEVISMKLLQESFAFHPLPTEELSFIWRHPALNASRNLYTPPRSFRSSVSMSLDEPEDLIALRALFQKINYLELDERIVQVLHTSEIPLINKRPALSIYTCAYNAATTLPRAIQSIQKSGLMDYEHLIHNDGSTDLTASVIVNFAGQDKRIKVGGSMGNNGLASSCNLVLPRMRGELCLRLDADDELLPNTLNEPITLMNADPLLMALYPAYYRNGRVTQNEEHHVGGALMRTRALKELRFCDELRHWEGRELYQRIVSRYHTMEYSQPTWIYIDSEGSLSNTPCEQRTKSEFAEFDHMRYYKNLCNH